MRHEWNMAVCRHIDSFSTIGNFGPKLNSLLQRHGAHIAGGFVARCILQYQMASAQFLQSDHKVWTFQISRYLPSTTDIDIYVPHKNSSNFFHDFMKLIKFGTSTNFHLSPSNQYHSFMRSNGILSRVQVNFDGRKCDILSCKRQISKIVQNFDLSGVCVSWDGIKLHMSPSIPQDMKLLSTYRFPQFRWSLNCNYVHNFLQGTKCTLNRMKKYTSLGIQIDVPTSTIPNDVQYFTGLCMNCTKPSSCAQWGNSYTSFCARHAPGDSHFAVNTHMTSSMLQRLFAVLDSLCINLSTEKKHALIEWKLKHCDDEHFFDITQYSHILQTFKAIYKLITKTQKGFLMWLCCAGEINISKNLLSFFESNASFFVVNKINFDDCRSLFSFILSEMLNLEHPLCPLHSCSADSSPSNPETRLHKDTDWYLLLRNVHSLFSATSTSTKWCIIVIHNFQRIFMKHELFLAIVDIALNNASYQITYPTSLYPQFRCISRGHREAIKSDSWRHNFILKNTNNLLDIYQNNYDSNRNCAVLN